MPTSTLGFALSMRVLVISDLHYDHKIYKGIDERKAWSWLMGIIDYHKPDLLLSCGDWGTAITHEKFYNLLEKCPILTIYGNHENLSILKSLHNIKTDEHLAILMKDGEVYEFHGLRIAGINGVVSVRRKSRKGIPRKRPDEYLRVARALAGKGLDVLLMHEVPYLPSVFDNIRDTVSSRVALEAVKIIRPRLVVNGHMHAGFKHYDFGFNTRYVNIDSSQASRYYVIGVNGCKRIEVWKDYEVKEVLYL